MIDKIACFGLEKAINHALAMDPTSVQRLQPLDGKTIALDIHDWRLTLYVRFTRHSVQLFSQEPTQIDTKLIGPLFGLMRVGLAKGSSQSMVEQQVSLEGDSHTAELARDLFAQLDIDWEDHLSRIVGDSLAYHLGRGAKRLLNVAKQAAGATRQSTTEYLQFEINALPCRDEVEDFYQDIKVCRDDVERLSARIALLKQGNSQ